MAGERLTSYKASYQTEAAAEGYEQAIYSALSHDTLLWEAEKPLLLRMITSACPNHKNAKALDFACGTGRILAFLRPLVSSLVGVDVSQAMLTRASVKVKDTQLVCTDIIANPHDIPSQLDIITSFRFLLLAEPPLRSRCMSILAGRLSADGVLIVNTHGNPFSVRLLASLRNRLLRPALPKLPAFSMGDLQELADECGLQIVAAAGVGFLPRSVVKVLPRRLVVALERSLSHCPVVWRCGTNLMVAMKRQ